MHHGFLVLQAYRKIHFRILHKIFFKKIAEKTYKVVEAKLLSSRLTCPSKAIPLRCILLLKSGVKYITFWRLDPGWIGQPSEVSRLAIVLRYWPFWKRTTSTPCWIIALIFFTTLFELLRTHMLTATRSPWKYNCLSNVTSSSNSPGLNKKSLRTMVHGWLPCFDGANWILRIPKVKVERRWVRSVSDSPLKTYISLKIFLLSFGITHGLFMKLISHSTKQNNFIRSSKNLLSRSTAHHMVHQIRPKIVARAPKLGSLV